MASVVDTIFLLLISVASNRQNKAHNYWNISTVFNVGALRVPQVSLKVSFTGTGLRSTSAAALPHAVLHFTAGFLYSLSTPQVCHNEELEEVFSFHLPHPWPLTRPLTPQGPQQACSPRYLTTRALLCHLSPARKPTFTTRPNRPRLFPPSPSGRKWRRSDEATEEEDSPQREVPPSALEGASSCCLAGTSVGVHRRGRRMDPELWPFSQ